MKLVGYVAFSALLFGSLGWWLSGQSEITRPAHKPDAKQEVAKSLDTKSSVPLSKAIHKDAVNNGMLESGSAFDLLMQFGLTGDSKYLSAAQKRFPDDVDVIFASCMTAESPDSEWLAKLEALQPDNSLPNFLRAGLFAKAGDVEKFKSELQIAASKPNFTSDIRERQARTLDAILAGKISPDSHYYSSAIDRSFMEKFNAIGVIICHQKGVLGEGVDAGQLATNLAHQLRQVKEVGFNFAMAAATIENNVLVQLDPTLMYGETQTVRQRAQELNNQFKVDVDKLKVLGKLDSFPEASRKTLNLQYFSRVRADGETSAVDWLVSQINGTQP